MVFITVQVEKEEVFVHMPILHLLLRYNHLLTFLSLFTFLQFLFNRVEGINKVMIVDFDAHQV